MGWKFHQVRRCHLKLPGQRAGIKTTLVLNLLQSAEDALIPRSVQNPPQTLARGCPRRQSRKNLSLRAFVDHSRAFAAALRAHSSQNGRPSLEASFCDSAIARASMSAGKVGSAKTGSAFG